MWPWQRYMVGTCEVSDSCKEERSTEQAIFHNRQVGDLLTSATVQEFRAGTELTFVSGEHYA